MDLGTISRLASDDQYRALVVRDGGCRWPGCEIPAAWCEVDHLVPFPAGPTDLINLVNTQYAPLLALPSPSSCLMPACKRAPYQGDLRLAR